jgi:serine phosphatase RsbU (regulator of sigma subunit)
MINSNLALVNTDMGNYEKALIYFEETLKLRIIKNEKGGIIAARINTSVVLNNLKRYDESIKHLLEALDIAREMNDYLQMRSCYGMLSETYEKKGDREKSTYYFDLYRQFHELIEGEKLDEAYKLAKEERLKKELAEKESQIKELEIIRKDYELIQSKEELKKTESEKMSLLDTLSKRELKLKYIENERKLEKAETERKLLESKLLLRNIVLFSAILLFVLFIVIFFYFQKRRSNRVLLAKNTEISQKNEEIEVQRNNIEELLIKTTEAHESIKSSIDYASFIQAAMINKKPYLSEFTKDSFIFYQPKDIVGGDFYWYTHIDNKLLIAAADCTGHGVPGAFLTVLGYNFLNQIVNISKETDPGKILEELHKNVRDALNQQTGDNKDGMDIALCMIDKDKGKLQFAGANNPLVYLVNDQLTVISGEKYGIGGHTDRIFKRQKDKKNKKEMFETHSLELAKSMQLYMFSDGYVDQNGGVDNTEMKSQDFIDLLFKNASKSFKDQKDQLTGFYNDWKAENEQVDDVLVLGVKI